jgi:hypothetical protein
LNLGIRDACAARIGYRTLDRGSIRLSSYGIRGAKNKQQCDDPNRRRPHRPIPHVIFT